jgi:hypothetical protein
MARAFLTPFVLHVGLIWALYLWLTVARAAAVGRGEATYAGFKFADGDPPGVAPIARNLANQFELPTLAWFSAAILMVLGSVGPLDVAAAWVFLVGRVVHSAVQILTDNVRLRGLVFLVNAAGVAFLAAHVAWIVFTGELP